VKTSDKI